MAYIGQNPIDAFRGLAAYDTFTGDGYLNTNTDFGVSGYSIN